MKRILYIIFLKFRIVLLRYKKKSKISINAIIDKQTKIEGFNIIGENTRLFNCVVGKYSYIQHDCNFSSTKIGSFCSIAPNVNLIAGNHPMNLFSTHPCFYKKWKTGNISPNTSVFLKEFSYSDSEEKFLCEIGNDVWIGQNANIMNGVKIGNGAVIAACSLVLENVEPYTVVAGVPARVIKRRFSKNLSVFLNESKWWTKSEKELVRFGEEFNKRKGF